MARKFWPLAKFMLWTLPGWRWRLPLTLLVGAADIAVLILIPLAGAKIIDSLAAGSWDDFRHHLTVLGGLTLAQVFVGLTHRYAFLCVDERSGNALRQRLVETALRKPLGFFDRHWVGDLVSRAINDSSLLKGFITGVLLQMVYDTASLIVVAVILVRMNPVLAALTMATAPLTLVYGRAARRRLEAAALRVRENVAAVTGHLQSWLSRPLAIKAYSLESVAARSFRRRNDELTRNSVRSGLLGAGVGAANATLLGIPSLLIFGYGGYLTFKGGLSVGSLFAFMTFSAYFSGPAQRFVNAAVATLPTLYPVFDRLQEILEPEDLEPAWAARPLPAVSRIVASNITFGFEKDPGYRLIVPDFHAKRGEVIGIVGPNGAGKSTLGRLLAGISHPSAGTVTLGREVDRHWSGPRRRRLFGFLPQEPAVFDGTLLENLTLFDDLVDEARVARVIELLDVDSWIDSLPQGVNTPINAGLATKFSVGQIKKIGLGRLLYRDPPILLLDEPAAGLDESSQGRLAEIIDRGRERRIAIVITHSPATVALCDRVYRLRPLPGEARGFECVEDTARSQPGGDLRGLLAASPVA